MIENVGTDRVSPVSTYTGHRMVWRRAGEIEERIFEDEHGNELYQALFMSGGDVWEWKDWIRPSSYEESGRLSESFILSLKWRAMRAFRESGLL